MFREENRDYLNCELDPQKFIRDLFAETQDNKLTITYDNFIVDEDDEDTTDITYDVDWTADDMENLVKEYVALVNNIRRIGGLVAQTVPSDEEPDEAAIVKELTEDERHLRIGRLICLIVTSSGVRIRL